MNQPARSSVLLLALAGLGSALFTVIVASAGYLQRISVGLNFGIALAVYFVWYEGYRRWKKMLGFIFACAAAFPAASAAGFPLLIVFPMHASMSSDRLDFPIPIFFAAGCIGAFIVLAAGSFLLGPRRFTWKFLGTLSLWSLGGGFLGVIGTPTDVISTHGYNHMFLLFLVWQPGVAILLGLLLGRERRALPEPSPVANS
jgi:hypothetical protein